MTPDRIEAVLFDLDDTLCTYERTQEDLLEIAFDRAGVEPFFTGADYRGRYQEFLEDSDGIEDLREQCFAAFAEADGRDPDLGRTIARHYAEARDPTAVRPLDGAPEAVATLAERYPLALVTNGAPEMQRAKLEAIGLEDAFETIVFAGHDAPAKPDPDPFERALSALATPPKRAVHVGNSLRSDVAGADAAGLYSVWTPVEDDETPADEHPDPDLRVTGVADLPERL